VHQLPLTDPAASFVADVADRPALEEESMATVTATASSSSANSGVAAREAVRAALAGLGGRKPSFGFLFVAPRHKLDAALAGARESR
jgi:hypothetical protein